MHFHRPKRGGAEAAPWGHKEKAPAAKLALFESLN
jgi:hypothetical protein